MNFTQATPTDIDFVTDAVFAAVKSGTNTLSYTTLFEKSEEKLRPLFEEMVGEDIEGQELCLSGFLIAKNTNNIPTATCCAWVEGKDGDSNTLTAQLFGYYFDIDTIQKILNKAPIIETLRVEREKGALQIEHVYTAPNHRGQGLAAQVIKQQIELHKAQHPELKKVQIILFKTNANALQAYTKMGFTVTQEVTSTHPDILNYFPSNTRVLMEMDI
jgi:predicted GNAT family acetyltransferase